LRLALVSLAVAGLFGLAACGSSSSSSSSSGTTASASSSSSTAAKDLGLLQAGTLTVGMNLQFKPEMYLLNGQPAGYDVDLLNELAKQLGVKLNIQNLDFNGLIPGLQGHKFDMVSVGLSNTPERAKAVDFSRAYVPYAQVLAVPASKAASTTSTAALNQSGKTITALQGSTAQMLAQQLFPKAKVDALPDQSAAFLEVATGRADGIVVEDYLLAQFQASNPGKLAKANIAKPLNVQYGSYAVPKGQTKLVNYLNSFICKNESNGVIASLYQKNFGVKDFPGLPPC
jgi:ABC-type amino acid transport substrate-binding protein